MRFATLNILERAIVNGYAVPAFNINSFEWITSALKAAKKESSPLILASSDRLSDQLGGFNFIKKMVDVCCEKLEISVPVVLHLDHGYSFDRCKEAIDAGYSSVMIDGSKLPIEKNIELTQRVVEYAKKYGVTVEAEVGCVGGSEDGVNSGILYANVEECIKLVKETNINALAAALGSVHGIYEGKPKLSFDRMKEIGDRINIPLVLHGASGIPNDQIEKCIKLKHGKININTECNQIWIRAIEEELKLNKEAHEPVKIIKPAEIALENFMRSKMVQFGSSGKAKEGV